MHTIPYTNPFSSFALTLMLPRQYTDRGHGGPTFGRSGTPFLERRLFVAILLRGGGTRCPERHPGRVFPSRVIRSTLAQVAARPEGPRASTQGETHLRSPRLHGSASSMAHSLLPGSATIAARPATPSPALANDIRRTCTGQARLRRGPSISCDSSASHPSDSAASHPTTRWRPALSYRMARN